MPPDQQPRRRISDGTPRRRYEDQLLDMIVDRQREQNEDIEELRLELRPLLALPTRLSDHLERFADRMTAQERAFEEWKTERREDIVEFRSDIAELQKEAKLAHKRIANGQDPDNGKPLKGVLLTWSTVGKVVTMVTVSVGTILVPIIIAVMHG